MKIACVDCSASGRLRLQQLLEEALATGRDSIGYVPIASFDCRSPREVVMSVLPDVVFIGAEMSDEHAQEVITDLRIKRDTLPIVVMRPPSELTVRLLRRFDALDVPVLSTEEPSVRILHLLIGFSQSRRADLKSRVVLIAGAKGGVGTSTLTAALAHSAMEIGKRALVVDLSRYSSLLHDLGVPRLHSTDYTALLTATEAFDTSGIDRLVTVAPNGIECLLPPAGSPEVRERWLRDPRALEQTLNLLELLSQQYDIVLVDHGHAEGLLAYALAARADSLLLVTSNDPASVYRTIHLSRELEDLPRSPRTFIALTLLSSNGLSAADAASFLGSQLLSTGISRPELFAIPYDRRGSGWVGTGNSLYTEGASDTRRRLVAMIKPLLHQAPEQEKTARFFGTRKGSIVHASEGADDRAILPGERSWNILPFRKAGARRVSGKPRGISYAPAPAAPLAPRRTPSRLLTEGHDGAGTRASEASAVTGPEEDGVSLSFTTPTPQPDRGGGVIEATPHHEASDLLRVAVQEPSRELPQQSSHVALMVSSREVLNEARRAVRQQTPGSTPRTILRGGFEGSQRGALALEHLLMLAATVVIATAVLMFLQTRANDLGARISDQQINNEGNSL